MNLSPCDTVQGISFARHLCRAFSLLRVKSDEQVRSGVQCAGGAVTSRTQMRRAIHSQIVDNDIRRLYSLSGAPPAAGENLTNPALRHLNAAWQALEALESNLPGGPDRWQADSLDTAMEGIRRAGLAASNLGRGLR